MYDENCLENKIDIVSSDSNNISANNNSPKTNIHQDNNNLSLNDSNL